MSRRLKFQTVGRDQHRHGRVACLLDVDMVQKKLFLSLVEARGLDAGFGASIPNAFVNIRMQLLPHKNQALVRESLLKQNVNTGNYKQSSQLHSFSPNPLFREEFVFDLTECWPFLSDFRLYICAVASVPVCSDGSGFLGLTSFSIDDVLQISIAKDQAGVRPWWWWLFSQETGMFRNQPVEMMIANQDQAKSHPDVIMSGRDPALSNSHINGTYAWQCDIWNGRPTYKHTENSRGLYLFYHAGKKAWAIGDYVGSTGPYAYSEDVVLTPDKSKKGWYVFNKEREYNNSRSSAKDKRAGKYEIDEYVRCQGRSAAPEQLNETLGLMSDSTQLKSPRTNQILRLIFSQAQLDSKMRLLKDNGDALKQVFDAHSLRDAYEQLFGGVFELGRCTFMFLEALLATQAKDPDFVHPIGPLFIQIISLLQQPLLKFCSNLLGKVGGFRKLIQTDAGLKAAVTKACIGGLEDLFDALEAPFLQIQRYPHYLLALAQVSASDFSAAAQQDAQILTTAQGTFDELAAQAIKMVKTAPEQTVGNSHGQTAVDVISDASSMPWYHHKLGMSEAAARLTANGTGDGTFLVRERDDKPGEFAIGVAFQGKISHHQIILRNNGILQLTTFPTITARSLITLVSLLSVPHDLWPVLLSKPVRIQPSSAVIPQEQSMMPNFTLETPVTVALVKNGKPLGMTFIVYPGVGPVIEKVRPGGPAEISGKISPGMLILSVNGTDTRSLEKHAIANLIKESDVVHLQVRNVDVSQLSKAKTPVKPVSKPDDFVQRESKNLSGNGGRGAPSFRDVPAMQPSQWQTPGGGSDGSRVSGAARSGYRESLPFELPGDKSSPNTVTLMKGFSGSFGFDIIDHPTSGPIVSSVKHDSNAATSGKIVEGMQIFSVNKLDVRSKSAQEINAILTSNDVVELETGAVIDREAGEGDISKAIDTNNANFYVVIERYISIASGELTLSPGSLLMVTEVGDGNQLWRGELRNGSSGFFPGRCVKKYHSAATVTVNTKNKPLGLSFVMNNERGAVINEIASDGALAAVGNVQEGMQLLAVNGVNTKGLTKTEISSQLSASDSIVLSLSETWVPRDLSSDKSVDKGNQDNMKSDPSKENPYGIVQKFNNPVNHVNDAKVHKRETNPLFKTIPKNVFSVTVDKQGGPLGLSFQMSPNGDGAVVLSVKENGPAAVSGKIKPGMLIVSINGKTTKGTRKKDVIDMFKEANVLEMNLTTVSTSSAKISVPETPESQPVTVEIEKNGGPLGFTFAMATDKSKAFITKITEGGAAAMTGKIKPGMAILSVNGKSTQGAEKKEIVDICKSSDRIILVVVKVSGDVVPLAKSLTTANNESTKEDKKANLSMSTVKKSPIKEGNEENATSNSGDSVVTNEKEISATALPITSTDKHANAGTSQGNSMKSSTKGRRFSAADIGKRVKVADYECQGTIRFVGLHAESEKPRVGVELDEPVGKHSGTVKGKFYFECKKKCGVLVLPKNVTLVVDRKIAAKNLNHA